jgi:hypothetical protein
MTAFVNDHKARVVLTAEDLLAGNTMTFDIVVPPDVLRPRSEVGNAPETIVRLRPLTLGTFLLIMRAAKEDSSLIPLLMIQEALVEPKLSLPQIRQMHLGLITFLIGHVRQISGLTEKKSPQPT